MLHREFEVPAELRDTINGFWYTSIDFGEALSSFEIMPDGYAEIVFHFGNACTVSYNDTLQPLPSPFIMGLLNQPVLLESKNVLEVIGIKCYPWTVFDILGLIPDKKGVHLFEHPIALLQSTLTNLINVGRIEEAVEHVKQYFLNARLGVATDSMLSKAGNAMREANGTMPISEVASAAHATVRTLERKFKQSSGHTVKDVSGLMRFEQARNHLWCAPGYNLASLAYELGYTDQSHLSKEFKRYSGTTPAAFARKAKNEARDFVVFVQS